MDLNENIKNNIIKSLDELGFNDVGFFNFKLNDEKYILYRKYVVYTNNGIYNVMSYKSVNDALTTKLRLYKLNKLENNIKKPIITTINSKKSTFINNVTNMLIASKKWLIKWI